MLARALFLGLLVATASAEARELRAFQSGAWRVTANADDATNRFSECTGALAYTNGISLLVSAFPGRHWRFGLLNRQRRWSYARGQRVGIQIALAPNPPAFVMAEALVGNLLVMPVSDNTQFVQGFGGTGRIEAIVQNVHYIFDLTDTSQLLKDLQRCVDEETSPGRDTRRSTAPPTGTGRMAPVTPVAPATTRPPAANPSPAPAPTPAPNTEADTLRRQLDAERARTEEANRRAAEAQRRAEAAERAMELNGQLGQQRRN